MKLSKTKNYVHLIDDSGEQPILLWDYRLDTGFFRHWSCTNSYKIVNQASNLKCRCGAELDPDWANQMLLYALDV